MLKQGQSKGITQGDILAQNRVIARIFGLAD